MFSQEYSNLGAKYLLLINQVLYLRCPVTRAALSFAQNLETKNESLFLHIPVVLMKLLGAAYLRSLLSLVLGVVIQGMPSSGL